MHENNLYIIKYNNNQLHLSSYTFDTKKIAENTNNKRVITHVKNEAILKCTALDDLLVCASTSGIMYSSLKSEKKAEFIAVENMKIETIMTRGINVQV